MSTLDAHEMIDCYFMNNTAIHKACLRSKLDRKWRYKAAYLPPYLLFLNPIALFAQKLKMK